MRPKNDIGDDTGAWQRRCEALRGGRIGGGLRGFFFFSFPFFVFFFDSFGASSGLPEWTDLTSELIASDLGVPRSRL